MVQKRINHTGGRSWEELPELTPKPIDEIHDAINLIPGFDPFRQADGFRFDPVQASHAVAWIERNCRHCKGALSGEQFLLLPWETAIVANLFGWVSRETGRLRHKTVLIYVAKKNGKSAFAAALLLYVLCGWPRREEGAELYTAASAIKQAGHVYNHVVGMIRKNEELCEALHVLGGVGGNQVKSIYYDAEFSALNMIAADGNTADGASVSCSVVDELHRFHSPKHHEFVNVLELGTASRREPITIYTTTADTQRMSVCNAQRDYALKVRDGVVVDPHFLPAVWEIEPDDDWRDENIWARANPSLGHTVEIEYLRAQFQRAEENNRNQAAFRRLHLNQKTKTETAWLDVQAWGSFESKYTIEDVAELPCWIGVDLASTKDLTAIVAYFPGETARCLCWTFAPRAMAEARSKEDSAPYLAWHDDGLLELTTGDYTDYSVVEDKIRELYETLNVQEIAFDPYNAYQMMTRLDGEGLPVWRFNQTFTNYTPAILHFERLYGRGEFRHDGNPILAWCASNACLDSTKDGEMHRLSKEHSSDKIDVMIALLMAVGRQIGAPAKKKEPLIQSGILDV